MSKRKPKLEITILPDGTFNVIMAFDMKSKHRLEFKGVDAAFICLLVNNIKKKHPEE